MNNSFVLASFITCISISNAVFFPNVYPQLQLTAKPFAKAGDPLLITPFLQHGSGSIDIVRNLAKVHFTDTMGFTSYAGFFTVNQQYDSNLYFWYFPPFTDNNEAPLLLWLQGGPGGSSLFGLFAELGPLIATKDGFALRKYHWAMNNHLIFIDNPVGAGFSYTKHEKGYCTNEKCIATGLYSAIQQFLTLFPNLRDNPFFIAGESYAGKYIPSFAMEIHEQNEAYMFGSDNKEINLKGLIIGNGWCDPINQIDYGSYLYQIGLIDENQRCKFYMYQENIVKMIRNGSWIEGYLLLNKLMDGGTGADASYFKMYTGMDNYHNLLYTRSEYNEAHLVNILAHDNVRKNIHVGGLPFNDGKTAAVHLGYDMLKSVAKIISTLLTYYKIVFYNGQLDIIVAYPLTENFLRKLDWPLSKDYKNASRSIWMVDNQIAGYVKRVGNLIDIMVRNAGHMVPLDQPKWALDMITRITSDNF